MRVSEVKQVFSELKGFVPRRVSKDTKGIYTYIEIKPVLSNKTAFSIAQELVNVLAEKGYSLEILSTEDKWNAWPKPTEYIIKFKMEKTNKRKYTIKNKRAQNENKSINGST
jgi:hypothetical protein